MAFPVSIPYYTSEDSLPSELPSTADILRASDVLDSDDASRVVRVAPHFVIKHGLCVNALDRQNMLFVAESTGILVPQVYAIYMDMNTVTKRQQTFIVMQNIEGNTLLEEWPQLCLQQKTSIATALAGYMRQLRKIPSQGHYGSLADSPSGSRAFVDFPHGRYKTESDFNEAMISDYRSFVPSRLLEKGNFFRRSFPCVFQNHPPVFTHANLQRNKIILRRLPRAPERSSKEETSGRNAGSGVECPDDSDYQLVLIDWAMSGWFPSYWEYCAAICAMDWQDDWGEWIEHFLEPYYAEYPWMQMIRSDAWE